MPPRGTHKGLSLNTQHNFPEAIACFDRVIELDPTNAGAWTNKGNALANQGRYRDAIECYERAIALEPMNAVARNNRRLALSYLD